MLPTMAPGCAHPVPWLSAPSFERSQARLRRAATEFPVLPLPHTLQAARRNGRRSGALALAVGLRRRRGSFSARPSRLQATSDKKAWDDTEDADLWENIRGPPPGQINSFVPGASLKDAKIFAATRTIAVAPWSEDVTPKPIFAISDGPGLVAELVAKMGFRQFGDISKSMVEVLAEVETKEDVKAAIDKAATLAPEESLAIEQAGAMVIFSMSDQEMAEFLVAECGQQGVPCINFMESVVLALESRLQLPRGSRDSPGAASRYGVFAVSDSSAEASYRISCKALKQFPKAKVQQITCCPGVKSLQEIDHIVQEALRRNGVIIYTLASPGMSRFLRQQCERAKVPYADVFQPVVIALKRYLDYPPVGVAGGHYSKEDRLPAKSLELPWEEKPIID
ncbi:unnamed protein product [Cladocopium goreaui]|uniref:Pyruvate, phosphate dikinase regulatory protein, chloroplastic n=1 Tax=Cladocopium goreaui TaxID=2562237 RepID=A0A9P1DGL6_9DINO|nr:unnamed protein product [Cladocopium goreaui]